jgi:hypothetical protein
MTESEEYTKVWNFIIAEPQKSTKTNSLRSIPPLKKQKRLTNQMNIAKDNVEFFVIDQKRLGIPNRQSPFVNPNAKLKRE